MIKHAELEAGLYWAEYSDHCFREIKIRKCLVHITGSRPFLAAKVIWPETDRYPVMALRFVERLIVPPNTQPNQTIQPLPPPH